MPADCAAPTAAPLAEVREVAEPQVGWPQALSAPSSFAEAVRIEEAARAAQRGDEDIPDDLCDAHCEAIGALLEFPAPDMASVVFKLRFVHREFGSRRIEDDEVWDGTSLSEEAAIVRIIQDLERLGSVPTPYGAIPCPASRLLDLHGPVYEIASEEDDAGVDGPGRRRVEQIVEQASWARARSLRGALYQVALAIGRNDFMKCEGANAATTQRELDHLHVERLLTSVMNVLHDHIGGDLPEPIDSYAGVSLGYVDRLSDDPQPFNAADFIDAYHAAGGSLSFQRDGRGDDGIVIICPRNPKLAALFLKDIGDPTRHESILTLLKARHGTLVNEKWAAEIVRLDFDFSEAIREMHEGPRVDWAIAESLELAERLLKQPCRDLASIRVKARIALDRIMRDGGSNWADKGEVTALQQIITFVDGEIGPPIAVAA